MMNGTKCDCWRGAAATFESNQTELGVLATLNSGITPFIASEWENQLLRHCRSYVRSTKLVISSRQKTADGLQEPICVGRYTGIALQMAPRADLQNVPGCCKRMGQNRCLNAAQRSRKPKIRP
jgi:hypothetical protein